MPVTEEVRDHVLIVRIDRPEKRNAIDVATADGIEAALNRLDDDPNLWVGVITGTDSVFCAGTDLKDGMDYATERGGEYGIIRRARRTPLIAAVEGIAFGGGFEIALNCDLIVASRAARFALPESLRGLVPTSGAMFRAPRALPRALAVELMITGSEVSGERLHDLGVINQITDPGAALPAALEMAEQICRSSPNSVREVLGVVQALDEAGEDLGWQVTDAAKARIKASADAAEGIAAFFEKRPPQWTGR
ncbi:enoyl-CoA hydratase-related protein [Kribbia dieselivorans]|uniref:enoyl-CoA hydratase-related protein n=1 Tax=Kribbia dieselivorans TaxID=331526 RepID=UPI000838AB94|nr:enoyl-CoA hydratase-related protein [Kribbia dieselivorans]